MVRVETVAGVDGCPGGWVAAVWSRTGVEWRLLPLPLGPALDLLAGCAVVAVDVPIGMPESGPRRCDVLAKQRLGRGAASVFMTPIRAALEEPDHGAACRLLADRGEKGMSIQTWHIGKRIVDATDAVAARGGRGARVVEAHPEVSFLTMTGEVLPPKRSAPGLAARLAALGEHFGDVPLLLRDAPRPARADDALDALACAWTARRVLDGTAQRLGENGMEIVS
jgi:predicted RNase H-like nuclease